MSEQRPSVATSIEFMTSFRWPCTNEDGAARQTASAIVHYLRAYQRMIAKQARILEAVPEDVEGLADALDRIAKTQELQGFLAVAVEAEDAAALLRLQAAEIADRADTEQSMAVAISEDGKTIDTLKAEIAELKARLDDASIS